MFAFTLNTFNAITQHIFENSLYQMMQSSHDFEDVRLALNDRTSWSIDLLRSSFTIHLINGSHFFMLCTLSFLIVAESIHIHFCRLSAAELKECAESMGYVAFSILFVILDIGFVVVRITSLVALSGTPGLATGLVLVSILSCVVLPLLTHAAKLVKQRGGASTAEGTDVEPGIDIQN